MIEKNLDLIYNLDYVVCLPRPEEEMVEELNYSFGNVYIFDNTIKGVHTFIDFIRKNNIKKIILVDFVAEFRTIINKLCNDIEIDILYTKCLAGLSDPNLLVIWEGVISLYNKGNIGKIGILDRGLYTCLQNKGYPVYFIELDIERPKQISKSKNNTIGILNYDYDPKHSFYNELSAVKLSGHTDIKIPKATKLTKDFLKIFGIQVVECNTMAETMEANLLHLYLNFTNTNKILFLKSMDMGIPCILGNCDMLDTSSSLKEMLVVTSDDDVDEIAATIKKVIKNKKNILKEYEVFRQQYSEHSKKSIGDFTGIPKKKQTSKIDEKLLSVVVPVYNVEAYLANSLDSIIAAQIENMEIIIINDGSPDGSEEIAKSYVDKYPNLIRYIKQKNHGLGNVRNVGMKNAKGKYIASIDSDDVIDSNFFKEAEPYMKNNIDIILCDWLSIFPNESIPTPALDSLLKLTNKYKSLLYSTIMPSTCNKIVKKSLYTDINLKFVENLKFEDLGTNPIVMLEAKTIKYIDRPYYHYMIRENSIMRTELGYDMIDILKILDQRILDYVGNQASVSLEELKAYVYYFRVEEFILSPIYRTDDAKKRKEMVSYITKNMYDILRPLLTENPYVEKLLEPIDTNTKKYIEERNQAFLSKKLSPFIEKSIKEKSYYIVTPALILYNYDNR